MMHVDEFCEKLITVANNYKTLYVKGCFGSPMTAKNKERYTKNNAYNVQHATSIKNATSDTFGFDCVCLIKGILWGWTGDTILTYGGAAYLTNDVPDVSANGMIQKCTGVSSDFKTIVKGALVWMDGHVGVYVGNGMVVECTPKWNNCVQISGLGNIGSTFKGVSENKTRCWTKWGLLPYVDYSKKEEVKAEDDERKLSINVNGNIVKVDGFITAGKTYVWLRDLADICGYNVTYDAVNKLPGIEEKK